VSEQLDELEARIARLEAQVRALLRRDRKLPVRACPHSEFLTSDDPERWAMAMSGCRSADPQGCAMHGECWWAGEPADEAEMAAAFDPEDG
jgi:hypothetical protein